MKPKVTVLMPVYNGEKYLREAMESILNQTFRDFEFLIINDGSTDNSVVIIQSYNDQRIRLVHNEKNMGLAQTCNRGIRLSSGEYIARMDCDDISLPDRLKELVGFMDRHPEVGICGSWIKFFGDINNHINYYPADHEQLKARLLFNTCFAHPSVIIRKEVLVKNNLRYNREYEPADDYGLWAEAAQHTRFANIPKALLLYRTHQKNISKIKQERQLNGKNKIRLLQLKRLGIRPTNEETRIHASLRAPEGMDQKAFIKNAQRWLEKIKTANETMKLYDTKALAIIIAKRWMTVCENNADLGFWIWRKFRGSPLKEGMELGDKKELAKFFAKCLLRRN